MHVDLTGKVTIVTGGGRGIGRELALRFAREGAIPVVIDVDESDLAALSQEFERLGVPAATYICDVRDEVRIVEVLREVADRYGSIDVLVNNAGVGATSPIDELDADRWDFCHDVNLKGTFLMCKAAIPYMKAQQSGRILNAASFAAVMPSVAHAAYASSKAAVAHFTRAIAGELGPWGITANAYAPGMVPTTLNHFDELPAERQNELLDTLTLRRWGSAQDIGNLLCFLASEQAGYITGTLMDISGGKFATQIPRVAYDLAASGDRSAL